jgi:putative salt-induced outer membrane protein
MNRKQTLLGVSFLLLAAVASKQAQAADAPDGLWHGGISVGGAVASGTTSSRVLTANADGARTTAADKLSVYGLVNNGRSQTNGVTTKTADLWRLGSRYDYNLSERLFAFGGGELEANKLQDLDSRLGLNTGLGYKVIREDAMTWDVFGGVGYSRSKYGSGITRKGAELVLGEESTHKLGQSSNFKQRLVYYPGQSDVGNRATLDAMLSTAIMGAWTLNVGGSARYNSKVPAGFKKTESLFTVGFGYKY